MHTHLCKHAYINFTSMGALGALSQHSPFGLHEHEGTCLSLDLYGVFVGLIWVGNEGFFGLDVYMLT